MVKTSGDYIALSDWIWGKAEVQYFDGSSSDGQMRHWGGCLIWRMQAWLLRCSRKGPSKFS